jgi:hypothetical protein
MPEANEDCVWLCHSSDSTRPAQCPQNAAVPVSPPTARQCRAPPYTPDHSTISRTRRLIDLDTHREVFGWVLGVLADGGLLKGQRIAIDATTLEANAAMRYKR